MTYFFYVLEGRGIFRTRRGLSLIEILVALAIASLLVYFSVSSPGPSDRDELDQAMDIMEKIVTFSINESILKNKITRVHFSLTNEEPKIKVEFNSDNEFVLPDIKKYDGKNLSTLEQEAKVQLFKKVSSKFKSIEEIDPKKFKIPSNVQILGIATTLRPFIVNDEETAIYTYPSGERDRALIIFSSFDQIAAFTVEPYTGEFKRDYITIKAENELEEEYEEAVEKIFSDWSQ